MGRTTAAGWWLCDADAVLSAAVACARSRAADDDRDDVGGSTGAQRLGVPTGVCGIRRSVRTVRGTGRGDSRMEAGTMRAAPGTSIPEKLGASAGAWAAGWLALPYLILRSAAADPMLPAADYVRALVA